MKYTTCIFDFDGTLVDSMPYWSQKMLNILDENHINYPKDIIRHITPLGDVEIAKYFQEVLHVNLSVEEMIKQMDAFALPKYRDTIVLKEGVADYLKLLRENGCSVNVLTASPHKMVDVCLKRNGIFHMFDHVFTCDDFGLTKSDVRIYEEAVRRIGAEMSRTAFFDDNINAIRTAAKAGLFTVGVYDKSGEEFEEQMKEASDVFVKTFADLPTQFLM